MKDDFKMKIENSQTEFKLKFDGQLHQIDANVLINSLIHTTSIIEQINAELNVDKKIEIKVKALDKGSFLIHIGLLETISEQIQNIFTKENIAVASAIISIFVGLFELKKHLKGKKPKKTEIENGTLKIENEKGNVLIVNNVTFNLYSHNPTINDALSQNFDTLSNDPSIEAFEITDIKEKPFIRIEHNEFESLSVKSEILEENTRTIVENATINIIKLSFEDKYKWEFYFRGNKISVKMNDYNFNDLINKGESFAKGDMLEVELQINQIFDQTVNTFINKSYEVNRVIKHIPRGEQQKFSFDGDSL